VRLIALGLIAVLAFSDAAQAQADSRWVQMMTDADGNTYEIDMQRSRIAGDTPMVWMRIWAGANSTLRADRVLSRTEIDCVNLRNRVLAIIRYEADGSSQPSPVSGDWQEIVPGSVMEDLSGAICQVSQQRR